MAEGDQNYGEYGQEGQYQYDQEGQYQYGQEGQYENQEQYQQPEGEQYTQQPETTAQENQSHERPAGNVIEIAEDKPNERMQQIIDIYKNNPLYVKDPKEVGGFSKYTVYTIAGEKVGGDGIERRFSEFFSLREKLRERWPGIYIPNTPPKKAVGNMDQKFIEKRTRLLNDFCFRLGRIPYLLDSQEINIFTSEGKDFTKKLEKLPKIELEEMLDRYTQAFPEYYETYDILVGKDKIVEFQRLIKKNLIDLKLLKTYCHAAYDKKNSEIGTYIKFIQSLESHEKLALMEFVDGDQNKLMFFNVSNSDLSEKTVKLGWNIKNPFKGLIWFVEEQEMDLEAYDESLNSFFELDALIEKLCNKIENLDKEIKKVQYGTKESKSKEKKLEALEQDKNITEKKYEQLKSIEKFAAYSYEINIPIFKQEKVYDYYETIRRFAEIMYHNESYNMEMWNIVRDGVDKYKAAGAA